MSSWYINEPTNHWFYPLIGSLLGVFLSGVVAVFIFISGKKIEKKRERSKQIERFIEVQNLLEFQINALQIPISLQIDSIISFLNLLATKREINLDLPIVTGYTPNELMFIRKDELYKVLVHERECDRKTQTGYFLDFRNSALFLIESKKVIPQWVNELNTKKQYYHNKFNEHLDKVMRAFDVFGIEMEAKRVKKGEDKFVEAVDEVIVHLQKIQGFRDIHVLNENLLKPIHSICKDKNIVFGDRRVSLILSDIMSALLCFDNYENIKSTYHELFSGLAVKMKESHELLNNSFSAIIKEYIRK